MSQPIQLRLINNTDSFEGFACVIMQKNLLPAQTESCLAWRVIEHLEAGEDYPFEFSEDIQVAARDYYGNFTPDMDAQYGLRYKVIIPHGGLVQEGYAQHPGEIDVFNSGNDFPTNTIDAFCRRSGELLAVKSDLPPRHTASFRFDSTIFLGVLTREEAKPAFGELPIISPDLLPRINTAISLNGISSADIVMTGRLGVFEFTLENIL